MPIRSIILSSVACSVVQYFSTNRKIFEEKVILHKIYVSIFCTRVNISHFMKKWTRYDQIIILAFMLSTFYSRWILMNLEFSLRIFEK
jgi:hypothetical protein